MPETFGWRVIFIRGIGRNAEKNFSKEKNQERNASRF